MKLIASGVTNSAARVSHPSSSRSSSSTTPTIRPALISATASVKSANTTPPSASISFDASHHTFVAKKKRRPHRRRLTYHFEIYSVDSISKPQASSSASGIYFEFLFRRAHSRSLVERMYWSGVSLNSFTTCSNDVTVGTTGPMGSGLPQLGFPRRFAIFIDTSSELISALRYANTGENTAVFILRQLCSKSKDKPGQITTRIDPFARNFNSVLVLLSQGIKLHHVRL